MAIGDTVATIYEDIHALVDRDTIRRKVLESARYHRIQRLWFSEREFSFNVPLGELIFRAGDGYLPSDFYEVVGDYLYILEGSVTATTRSAVRRVSENEFWSRKGDGTAGSYPEVFSLRGGQLHVYPAATRETDYLSGRYVANIDVPTARWNSSAGGFFEWVAPSGVVLSDAELDAFESEWFTPGKAETMVRARATYLLMKETLKDPDGANDAMVRWLEEKAALDDESEQRQGGGLEVSGWLLD